MDIRPYFTSLSHADHPSVVVGPCVSSERHGPDSLSAASPARQRPLSRVPLPLACQTDIFPVESLSQLRHPARANTPPLQKPDVEWQVWIGLLLLSISEAAITPCHCFRRVPRPFSPCCTEWSRPTLILRLPRASAPPVSGPLSVFYSHMFSGAGYVLRILLTRSDYDSLMGSKKHGGCHCFFQQNWFHVIFATPSQFQVSLLLPMYLPPFVGME